MTKTNHLMTLIGDELTKHAIDELLALGKLDELEDRWRTSFVMLQSPQPQNSIVLGVSHG